MRKVGNGHARPGHNSGILWLSRSYNNVEKDPEIDRFRTLFQKERRLKEDDLAVLAGLATATVKNMFGGKTRRPLHSTFAKLAGAMDYEYTLVRTKAPNYDKEIPKAREQRKIYRATLARRRERADRNSAKK